MGWIKKIDKAIPHDHDYPSTNWKTRDFDLGSRWECGICKKQFVLVDGGQLDGYFWREGNKINHEDYDFGTREGS